MADLDNGLKMLLRASDDVKATLEVLVIPTASDTQIDTPVHYRQPTVSNFRTRRIVAVISHKDELDHHEEGSVFVLKQKPQNHAYPESLEIQRVFPVCGDFSISMAQMRVGSVGGSQDRTG
ncbi:hypothetical protein BDZ89DRAFT_717233 [Hymenopellis radicata]|nr:hypothetical protein BDZ89DRAFT_717233 [Hymenopellis radicata]